ncbi:MCE family protein [Nocardioides humilatus]|uniref:MCE family protein n=1 Tax=Nocardioides humilatus TaxID=2607660 RepID=A0A5B1LML0_9ACTN|nr:MCE family protein [Nocardioides humilatus]KAA1421922.1 MCE family protein [Nocardioides humilatus]
MSRPGTRSRIPSSAWKMAVFVSVTLVLIGVLATLIGNISFTSTKTYYARFSDATGVLHGDRVRLSGMEVGTVQDVELVAADGGRRVALIEFKVREEIPVLEGARLELRYENIVGQRYLAIEESTDDGDPMEDGGTFPIEQTTPAVNLTELFNGFQPLLRALDPEQTNTLAFEIVRAFQGESVSIANLLADTADLTNTLADKDQVIGRVVTNLNDVLGTVDTRDQELSALIVQFRDLMMGLSDNRDAIAVQLPRLADLLEGTTDLIRDVRPPLARTVRGLRAVARQLDLDKGVLADSLREIPRKLRLMARTGSYGSWFNFYVCGAEIRVKLLGDTIYLGTPGIAANESNSVCAGADARPEDQP